MTPPADNTCPEGHVRLHLYRVPKKDKDPKDPSQDVYLEIPNNTIDTLCFHPIKYLQYLGWCILAVDGVVSNTHGGAALPSQGNLEDRATYYYVTASLQFNRVVDICAIERKSTSTSSATSVSDSGLSRSNFRSEVRKRDLRCVFTGTAASFCAAMYIIPHARTSGWLQCIIENRPNTGGPLADFHDINDCRNGLLGDPRIHIGFDSRFLAVLRTPNHVLDMSDVPSSVGNTPSNNTNDAAYPANTRLTIQWLAVPPDTNIEEANQIVPHNTDAKFKLGVSVDGLPPNVLLDYIYGATALQQWGKNSELLARYITPRPEPLPVRTSKRRGLDASNLSIEDAEQMVMLFWGNNRHKEAQESLRSRVVGWTEDCLRASQ